MEIVALLRKTLDLSLLESVLPLTSIFVRVFVVEERVTFKNIADRANNQKLGETPSIVFERKGESLLTIKLPVRPIVPIV